MIVIPATKEDIIIVDKQTDIDLSSTPATVVLFYPDVTCTEEVQNEYLKTRALALYVMSEHADVVVCPRNKDVVSFVANLTNKTSIMMYLGVFRRYFDFVPRRFPQKTIERGFCWSLGSTHRDPLIQKYNLTQVHGWGAKLIVGLSRCKYVFNAHFTKIRNNESRLTEIPLSFALPVSEQLSDPEFFSDLYIVPLEDFHNHSITQKEYMGYIRSNIIAVRKKYNSLEALRDLLKKVGKL